MTDIVPQASFNSGEWAPSLFARVDIQKFRSGAALLENWFVDYRGGAANRPGTKYVIQTLSKVRLIPFQVTSEIGYICEFGDHYIRFIFEGAMVLENAFNISGATKADPVVVDVAGNNFTSLDVVFVTGVGGMTPLNGRYFQVLGVAGSNVSLGDLNGNAIDSTAFPAYTSGGTIARVYKIVSPYADTDLADLKYAQVVNQMIICSPNFVPYVLTENSANDWTIDPIVFGTTAAAPGTLTLATSLSSGPANYSYVVTSVDGNGQESVASPQGNLTLLQDMQTNLGTNNISWDPVAGASYYNVYKADVSYLDIAQAGAIFGFIGFTYGTLFADTNIDPDFSVTPPISNLPWSPGGSIGSVVVTGSGQYTSVPHVTPQGAATLPAQLSAVLGAIGTPTVGSGGTGYAVNDTVNFPDGVVLVVSSVGGGGVITAYKAITIAPSNPGSITSGSVPSNPVTSTGTSGAGAGATANFEWGVISVTINFIGAGYLTPPFIHFQSGVSLASATATLSNPDTGNPTVPGFFQERLVLAAPPSAPETFFMSVPGQFFNFNIHNPVQANDSIASTLVSGVLNTIKSIVSSTAGMLLLADNGSWIVNGGGAGSAVSPAATVATAQSYNGANDVRPIIANYDILYVQQKGASIRDLAFNIYFNIFTGSDISILSSHLFLGHQILEWAWAEEPFRLVWAVRDDGVLLSCTFMKEQEFIAWAHHVTDGTFESVASVTEAATNGEGFVDATYVAVGRGVNSMPTVQTVDVSAIWSGDFAYDVRQQQVVVGPDGFFYFNSGASICRVNVDWNSGTLSHFNYTSLVFASAGVGNTINGLRTDGTNILALTSSGSSGGSTKWTTLKFQPSNFTLGGSTGMDGANTSTGAVGPFGYMALYSGNWYATQGEPPSGPPTNTRVQRINAATQTEVTIDLSSLVSDVNGDALIDLSGGRVFFCAPSSGKLVQIDLASFDLAHASIAYDLTTLTNWHSGVSPSPTNALMHAWIDDADTNIYILYQTTSGGVNCARINLSSLTVTGTADLTVAYGGGFSSAVDRPIDGWTWANGHTYILSSSILGPSDNGVTRVIDIDSTFTVINGTNLTTLDSALTAGYASWTSDGTSFYAQPVYVDLSSNTFLLKYTPESTSQGEFIERLDDRINPNLGNAWFVDAGASYSGAATSTFYGAEHLGGYTVTGIMDEQVITPFVMPGNGTFTLPSSASNVVIGIGFNSDLQTLPMEVGDPSVQGQTKHIPFVDVRVADTQNLQIGPDFDHLVTMKDLTPGNISSMLTGQETQTVPSLYNGDARTFLPPTYTTPGQYCIRQNLPLPATVLGVFPAIVRGDTNK